MIWKDKNNRLISKIKLMCCPVLTALENTPTGMKLRELNTLAIFSAISTEGNNFCDFLFALKQLAGQVVDASEFESPIGRVHLMSV